MRELRKSECASAFDSPGSVKLKPLGRILATMALGHRRRTPCVASRQLPTADIEDGGASSLTDCDA